MTTRVHPLCRQRRRSFAAISSRTSSNDETSRTSRTVVRSPFERMRSCGIRPVTHDRRQAGPLSGERPTTFSWRTTRSLSGPCPCSLITDGGDDPAIGKGDTAETETSDTPPESSTGNDSGSATSLSSTGTGPPGDASPLALLEASIAAYTLLAAMVRVRRGILSATALKRSHWYHAPGPQSRAASSPSPVI